MLMSKETKEPKCQTCSERLMPLWKTSAWRCYKCGLEQELKEEKPVDTWHK